MIDLKFEKGLVPVVVQEARTGKVLMVAYANDEAVRLTRETGFAHYFSRSRKRLWKKGEESGHIQKIREILVDCDEDCLLYLVEQEGAACHTGYLTCFYRTIDGAIVSEQIADPSRVYARKSQ